MKALAIVGLIACLASVPALADCVDPLDGPRLPDGATASREEMVSAQETLKAYDTAVKGFVECVQRTNGNGVKTDRSNVVKADRAVERLTSLADKFNAELRAFKKKASGA